MVGVAVMLKIGQQESNEDDIKIFQAVPLGYPICKCLDRS